ncbi:MAG TPA: septal ring lytic transglycosylase RlpA family protein [Actinomycetota bacterium]|nr:septal ring lytic transglycosylase RlpA family protein [Actinomycetota bacterium]
MDRKLRMTLALMMVLLSSMFSPRDVAVASTSQERVGALSKRLGSLIAQMNRLEAQATAAQGRVGVSNYLIDRARQRQSLNRSALEARVREAYMRGIWPEANLVFGLRGLREVLNFSRYLGESMAQESEVMKRYVEAEATLARTRSGAASEESTLNESLAMLQKLRNQVQVALDSESRILASSRAEIARLKARRAVSDYGVSLIVTQRRIARQRVLDEKLAALIEWYSPAAGTEPFMPPKLTSTGVVTTGRASWYGPGFDGRRASSGATYHQEQMTAASLVLPFGTLLKVTFRGRSVVVVITDRGPYVAGLVLDLSKGASAAIGHSGVQTVTMEILTPTEPAPAFP